MLSRCKLAYGDTTYKITNAFKSCSASLFLHHKVDNSIIDLYLCPAYFIFLVKNVPLCTPRPWRRAASLTAAWGRSQTSCLGAGGAPLCAPRHRANGGPPSPCLISPYLTAGPLTPATRPPIQVTVCAAYMSTCCSEAKTGCRMGSFTSHSNWRLSCHFIRHV